jgi:hypothetical protein
MLIILELWIFPETYGSKIEKTQEIEESVAHTN